MTTTTPSKMTLSGEREIQAAVQGQWSLAAHLASGLETQRIQIFDERNQARGVELPTSTLRLLVDTLAELADGNAVKVVPVHAELTAQKTADLLGVSRPHPVKLLEDGAFPFHRTGKHRHVPLTDLMRLQDARASTPWLSWPVSRRSLAWGMNEALSLLSFTTRAPYPVPLRDFLRWLGLSGRFRARWSRDMHEESKRSLLANRRDLRREQLDRTSDLMDRQIPDAPVAGYQNLVPRLALPDPDDRHVPAATTRCEASVIVTFSQRDFLGDALTFCNIVVSV